MPGWAHEATIRALRLLRSTTQMYAGSNRTSCAHHRGCLGPFRESCVAMADASWVVLFVGAPARSAHGCGNAFVGLPLCHLRARGFYEVPVALTMRP